MTREELLQLTVPALKEYAAKAEIDLQGATKKADIIEAIVQAEREEVHEFGDVTAGADGQAQSVCSCGYIASEDSEDALLERMLAHTQADEQERSTGSGNRAGDGDSDPSLVVKPNYVEFSYPKNLYSMTDEEVQKKLDTFEPPFDVPNRYRTTRYADARRRYLGRTMTGIMESGAKRLTFQEALNARS